MSRFARQQIESYLKRCRSCKKMPFDFVVGMSCNSKFSLALTNDNRTYFWGTRTHSKEEGSSRSASLQAAPRGRSAIEPQLVTNCSDECFIKIGTTNQSLMSTMQVLGSDQPIIQARDPQLIARSLSELWILDYEPTPSCSARQRTGRRSSSDSTLLSAHLNEGSRHRSSCGSGLCPFQTDNATISSYCSSCSSCRCSRQGEEDNYLSSQKHDAILEPQPIVSLFVPSMFKQSGCALQLVNLFCFEEDRFFLVLDTTVKFRQHQPSLPAASSSIATKTSTMQSTTAGPNCTTSMPTIRTGHQTLSSSRRGSHSFKHPQESAARYQSNSNLIQNHQPHNTIDNKWRLNEVEESRSSGTNSKQETKQRPQTFDGHHHATQALSLSSGDGMVVLECCRGKDGLLQQSYLGPDDSKAGCSVASPQSANRYCHTNQQTGPVTNSPISCNGFSLEEPRSMSTFVPGFNGNHIAIVGPDLDHDPETLTRLSFNNYEPSYSNATIVSDQCKQMQKHHRRKGRRQSKARNKSESTVITPGYEDDTSSMPTWVKNEYMQQMGEGVAVGSITLSTGTSTVLDADVDVDVETTDETCLSGRTESTFGSQSSAGGSTLLNRTGSNRSGGEYADTNESHPDDRRRGSDTSTSQEARPSTSGRSQGSRSLTSSKSMNCRMSFAISSRLTGSQPNLTYDSLELGLQTNRGAKASAFNNQHENGNNLVAENLLDCCVYKKHQQSRAIDSNLMMNDAIEQPASVHSRYIMHDDSGSVKSRRSIAGSRSSDLENCHEQEIASGASKQKRWILQSEHYLSGRESSLLVRSLQQLKVADVNNNNNSNNIEGSLKKGANRLPGQSRTSLSSIGRSLVRIFC